MKAFIIGAVAVVLLFIILYVYLRISWIKEKVQKIIDIKNNVDKLNKPIDSKIDSIDNEIKTIKLTKKETIDKIKETNGKEILNDIDKRFG